MYLEAIKEGNFPGARPSLTGTISSVSIALPYLPPLSRSASTAKLSIQLTYLGDGKGLQRLILVASCNCERSPNVVPDVGLIENDACSGTEAVWHESSASKVQAVEDVVDRAWPNTLR